MNNNMNNSTSTTTAPTRKRGRPRKEKTTVPVPATPTVSASTSTPAPAKKRGRPRKVQKTEATDLQKITNVKNFIMKYHPSVANGTEETRSDAPESMKMAKSLWEKVYSSMSLGSQISQASNFMTKMLTNVGVIVAAGNEASDASTEAFTNNILDVSNFGECLDIFAPGQNIHSVGIQSNTDIVILSGTSQAAAHVVGTIALIISEFGNQKPDEMLFQNSVELLNYKNDKKSVVSNLKIVFTNRSLY
ncbi:hypothetical protein Glove_309g35 [Diversispora epigaea]|uniref:Peptidase S8/S53 domain-containing protein n=1 Tax=Diversispora epigaea TaxID=1348612 RepID=A0A397HX11_9GLOM|nr:hypothetical protein Glove_309g35 [Diversispora epigaea]